jgi:hypothetical protein
MNSNKILQKRRQLMKGLILSPGFISTLNGMENYNAPQPLVELPQTQDLKEKPDPLIGTWKLIPSASKASPESPTQIPAQRTEVYRLTDSGQIEFAILRPNGSTGAVTTSNFTFSARGGLATRSNPIPGGMTIETRVAPGEWLVTHLRDGVQVGVMRKLISPDGKTMRQTVTGLTPEGKPYERVMVFERQ